MTDKLKNYYIGLDLGTSSIGWAVVDNNNELIRKRGTNLWGVRLFDPANTASERRAFRRQRRTINKRKWRLHLLKTELKDFVFKEDDSFYRRLENSWKKDHKFQIFTGKYNDFKYFRDFPTIYHLRRTLMSFTESEKLFNKGIYYRLLFLALNDILKTRGHFLSNFKVSDIKITKESIFKQILTLIEILNNDDLEIDSKVVLELLDQYLTEKQFNARLQSTENIFVKAILGYKFNPSKIFSTIDNKSSITFDNEEWETQLLEEEVQELMGLFEIYSAIKIFLLLGEHKTLSEAKIKIYDKHKNDVAKLKEDLKSIDRILNTNFFNNIFVDENYPISYTKYVGKILNKDNKIRIKKSVKREDLIKELAKIKTEYEESFDNNQYLLNIYEDDFLKTQKDPVNRLIPHQFHEYEMNEILSIFGQIVEKYENKKDLEKQKLSEEKIKQILKFKVPYYVGPLGDFKNNNYWLVKNKDHIQTKITPFNFEEVVDKEATNKAFMKNLLRTCTYLREEPCEAQETLLYQEYIFFNVINKLRINNNLLSNSDKSQLFNLFIQKKKVSKKDILKLLNYETDAYVSGVNLSKDDYFNISLSAHQKFLKIFPEKLENLLLKEIYDEVVNKIGNIDKNDIELRKESVNNIIKEYKGINIAEEEINKLSLVTSNKWGNLSKKFLQELNFVSETGEMLPLIEILRQTNLNLNEIIYLDEKNMEIIDSENKDVFVLDNINDLNEYLKDRYIAPQARRTIIQANRLVDEIIKIMGGEIPSRIAIEFTRERQKFPRETETRYEKLVAQLKNIKDDILHERLTNLKLESKENKLKSRKVYLYFLQLGKDIYTGEPINWDRLLDDDAGYDLDHIIPQSLIKDDSLDNLVLTSNTMNAKKGNTYPVNLNIISKQLSFWQLLRKNNLMTAKKYENLIRKTPLREDELNDFINRQKTTLDWINIEIADIFKKKYGKTDEPNFIIYSKSAHVSNLRNSLKLYKIRELNNFHHAHDAYLSIVAGKALQTHYAMRRVNSFNYESILRYRLKDKFSYIKKIFNYHDILITRKTEIKNVGELWDQLPVKDKKTGRNSTLHPRKEDMPTDLYGGYDSLTTAFFSILKKGNKQVFYPIRRADCKHFYNQNNFDEQRFQAFIENLGYEVVHSIIPIGSKVILDGCELRVAGKTGNSVLFHNVGNVILPQKSYNYLRDIVKTKNILRDNRNKKIDEYFYIFSSEENIELFKDLQNYIINTTSKEKSLFSSIIYNRVIGDEETDRLKQFLTFDIDKQVETLYLIFTNLLKSNASNQGKIFDLHHTDLRKTQNINYNLSLIKESITGFYKKILVINRV